MLPPGYEIELPHTGLQWTSFICSLLVLIVVGFMAYVMFVDPFVNRKEPRSPVEKTAELKVEHRVRLAVAVEEAAHGEARAALDAAEQQLLEDIRRTLGQQS